MHQDSTFYFLKKKTFVSIVRKKNSKSWKPKRKETNVGHSRKAKMPPPPSHPGHLCSQKEPQAAHLQRGMMLTSHR